jgi:hypothetical protein
MRRRRRGALVERFKKLAQVSTHNDATQHPRPRRSVLAWGGSCGQLAAASMRLRLEAMGAAPADARPYLRRPLRLEAPNSLRRSPTHAPADHPKGSVHSPPQPCEDPKDRGPCGKASPQPTAAMEKRREPPRRHNIHKTPLRLTKTTSPWPSGPRQQRPSASLHLNYILNCVKYAENTYSP